MREAKKTKERSPRKITNADSEQHQGEEDKREREKKSRGISVMRTHHLVLSSSPSSSSNSKAEC